MTWILTNREHVDSDSVIAIEKHEDHSLTLRLTDGSKTKVSKQDAKAALDILAPAGLPSQSKG